MSSDESDSNHDRAADAGAGVTSGPVKHKRTLGACNSCKKRKSDSAVMPDNLCTNCRTQGIKCVRRLPQRMTASYVSELEDRVASLQAMLEKVDANLVEAQAVDHALPPHHESGDGIDDAADLEYIDLMAHVRHTRIDGVSENYFGPSSNLYFMRKSLQSRGITGEPRHSADWGLRPWELTAIKHQQHFTFPDPLLLSELVDLYFSSIHRQLPLLYEPAFRNDVASGFYLCDRRFATITLLVCALGARVSDDPRVFEPGASEHSAGWPWFSQILNVLKSPFEQAKLQDVQCSCLTTQYLLSTSGPQAAWHEIGNTIRYCVTLGYHRFRPGPSTVEREQKKRAFWCTYLLDRHLCFYFGKPSSYREEDFDVELPLNCDDEFWDAAVLFDQPRDRPSRAVYFLLHIKLCQIMSYALRTLYSLRKSKQAEGLVGNWVQTQVALMDSMLNKWFESIPPHLRWDAQRDPNPFLTESVLLYATYYYLQIQIHRPFISKESALSTSSMALCTHAARSCVRMLEVYQRQGGNAINFGPLGVAVANFTSGIVLTLRMAKHLDSFPNDLRHLARETEDIHRCFRVLQASSKRYFLCAKLIDSLTIMSPIPPPPDTFSPPSAASTPDFMFDLTATMINEPVEWAPPIESTNMDFGLLLTEMGMGDTDVDMSFTYDPAMFSDDASGFYSAM